MSSMPMRPMRKAIAVALGCWLVAGAAGAEPPAPGVTDLSGATPQAIESGDIVEALGVPRGTRIRPNERPTLRLPIYFELDSAELVSDAEGLLDKLASALASGDLETFRFSIEGHTDSLGSENYNEHLSSQRAKAVRSFLMARGVSADRLESVGHGEAAPVAPNEDGEGRKRNRRVEIVNLGPPE